MIERCREIYIFFSLLYDCNLVTYIKGERNEIGKEYLNSIKKNISVPIITNIKKKDEDLLNVNIRCEKIYSLITYGDINSYKNPPIYIEKGN